MTDSNNNNNNNSYNSSNNNNKNNNSNNNNNNINSNNNNEIKPKKGITTHDRHRLDSEKICSESISCDRKRLMVGKIESIKIKVDFFYSHTLHLH